MEQKFIESIDFIPLTEDAKHLDFESTNVKTLEKLSKLKKKKKQHQKSTTNIIRENVVCQLVG